MSSLAPWACCPQLSKGRFYKQASSSCCHAFQCDHNRIIHARAFRKLQHKTQVFPSQEGDFHRTRLTHSLEVAQLASILCRALRLQEDLGVTIALAHDLGHPPFGHIGETAIMTFLKDRGASLKNRGASHFNHNHQTMRIVCLLESPYPGIEGLNLTWEVLDGLFKHNGPPEKGSPLSDSLNFMRDGDFMRDSPYAPGEQTSLEAQVAALCDDIAYNCHDLDDGLRADLFRLEDLQSIPQIWDWLKSFQSKHPGIPSGQVINGLNRLMTGNMIEDVVKTTSFKLTQGKFESAEEVRKFDQLLVCFSDHILQWLKPLRAFLLEHMYHHRQMRAYREKMTLIVIELMDWFYTRPQNLPEDWFEKFKNAQEPLRILVDYVSGMTDRYALICHEKISGIKPETGLYHQGVLCHISPQ